MSDSKDLEVLQREADGIVNRACELLKSWTNTRTDLTSDEELSSLRLAHYTSLAAIVSMLQTPSGSLRLSDTSTMNDPYEGGATMEDRTVLQWLENEFGKETWLCQRYGAANVCCFVGIAGTDQSIDPGNDLLFWRLYGNDCRGISITLPPHLSKNLVSSLIVDRVMYTDKPSLENDLSLFSSLIRDLDALRCRAHSADLWSKICPKVLAACEPLFKQRLLSKRPHYKPECDYRAVAFQSEDDAYDTRYSDSGRHVRYATYSQIRLAIPELSCAAYPDYRQPNY